MSAHPIDSVNRQRAQRAKHERISKTIRNWQYRLQDLLENGVEFAIGLAQGAVIGVVIVGVIVAIVCIVMALIPSQDVLQIV